MRIISKFKDYYDLGIAYGIDQSLVYVRAQKKDTINPQSHPAQKVINQIPRLSIHDSGLHRWYTTGYEKLTSGVIGFCGRYFPFTTYNNTCFYTIKSLREAIGLDNKVLETGHFRSTSPKDFESLSTLISDELFVLFNCPLFVIQVNAHGGCMITTNPTLKDYNFYQQLDAYSAFQQVSMYLSNVLTDRDAPIDNRSDEEKITSKGFDKDWSFRKKSKKR